MARQRRKPAPKPAEVEAEKRMEDVVEEVAKELPEAVEPCEGCEKCEPQAETFKALVITKKDRNTLKVAEVRVDGEGNIVELVAAKKGLKFQIIRTLARTLQRF